MEELVSIIVPCFNDEKHVSDAILSIYEQDYDNIELIVVNDGSTDKSEYEILKWKDAFAKEGRKLKYVYQENHGLGGAINTGLKYITGDYLSLLDSDDRYLQGNIRKKVEFLQSHPDYSIVRTNGWICNGKNRWLFIQNSEETDEDYFKSVALHKTNNWAGSYMVRTNILFEFYKDRNIYPSRFGQNFQIILPVAYKNKCGYIDEPLMEYIKHPDSLTITTDLEKQYQNEKLNREGYRDIFRQVINQLVDDETERNGYLNLYDVEFERNKLELAIQHQDSLGIKESINWLKNNHEYKLDDKIRYYSLSQPVLAFFLRCIRKVRNCCDR